MDKSLNAALGWLERHGTKRTRDGMPRYGIPSDRAFGVTVGELKVYAKTIGKDHALAQALWTSGWYEARMLAAFVDDPREVPARQMDRWAADFDSWAICDTVCFHLFDRLACLPLIETGALDERDYVKKGVDMAHDLSIEPPAVRLQDEWPAWGRR
jgi:3-methyladenine DNA glycosylase AlkD